ncbi:hypothetical protein MKW98_020902, partial [Papaver atlanticum]
MTKSGNENTIDGTPRTDGSNRANQRTVIFMAVGQESKNLPPADIEAHAKLQYMSAFV